MKRFLIRKRVYSRRNRPLIDRPLRVLQIVDKLGYGERLHGIGRLWINTIDCFDPKRYQIIPCVLRLHPEIDSVFRKRGVFLRHLNKSRFALSTVSAILKVIREERIDLLHLNSYGTTTFGRIASLISGVPALIHHHDTNEKLPAYFKWIDRLLAPITFKAIGVTRAVAEVCVRRRHIPKADVTVIPTAIETSWARTQSEAEKRTLRERTGIPEGAKVLGSVTRFFPSKNVACFLRAAEKLVKKHGCHVLLLGDGPERPNLEKQIAEAGIAANVHILGFCDDVRPYVSIMDVFVSSSDRDGLPIAVLEAMAMKKPLAVTAAWGMEDAVKNDSNGFIVPVNDSDALAEAMEKIVTDPDLAERLAAQAKRDVENFSGQAYAARVGKVYDEVWEAYLNGEVRRKAPQPVRILNLIDRFYPEVGGAETQRLKILTRLAKKGFVPSVLTRASKPGLAPSEEIDGIWVRRLCRSRLRWWSKAKFFFAAIRYLIRYRDKYDIVHVDSLFQYNDILPAWIAHIITRKPYVIHIHGSLSLSWMFKEKRGEHGILYKELHPNVLPKFLWKRAFQDAAAIITINSENDRVLDKEGIRRYVRIPNAVALPERTGPEGKKALRYKLGLDPDSKIAIYSGALKPDKNVITLLKAWKLLQAQKSGEKAQLVIMGGSTNPSLTNETELRRYVENEKLESVVFTGYVSNVFDYLRAADLFVFPSLHEGMSNACLEAMACGLPMVVSKVSGLTDIVPDESLGMLCHPLSPEDFYAAIREFFDSPERLLQAGSNAWLRALKHYSFDEVVGRFASVYESVLEGRFGKRPGAAGKKMGDPVDLLGIIGSEAPESAKAGAAKFSDQKSNTLTNG